jgi:hypothetical protein
LQEIVQSDFIVIKELSLKTKTQSFVLSAITALLVQSIRLFVQQEQLHSKEAAKQLQTVKFVRKDSIVLKAVHHSLSVQKAIIVL